jgi:hypothetical protein
MKTFKTKSLTSEFSDSNIENGCFAIRFISFEAAIRLFSEEYKISDNPIGYKITVQGIEILYK